MLRDDLRRFYLPGDGIHRREGAKFKEEYIAAFNKMEATLKAAAVAPELVSVDTVRFLLSEYDKKDAEVKQLTTENQALRPKAEYYDAFAELGARNQRTGRPCADNNGDRSQADKEVKDLVTVIATTTRTTEVRGIVKYQFPITAITDQECTPPGSWQGRGARSWVYTSTSRPGCCCRRQGKSRKYIDTPFSAIGASKTTK